MFLLFIVSLMFISFLFSSYQRPNYIKNVSHFLDLQNIRIQRNTLHQIIETRADHALFLIQHIKQLKILLIKFYLEIIPILRKPFNDILFKIHLKLSR